MYLGQEKPSKKYMFYWFEKLSRYVLKFSIVTSLARCLNYPLKKYKPWYTVHIDITRKLSEIIIRGIYIHISLLNSSEFTKHD